MLSYDNVKLSSRRVAMLSYDNVKLSPRRGSNVE